MSNLDDSSIEYDEDGICNHCHTYSEAVKNRSVYLKEGLPGLEKIVSEIKKKGENKPYDCIIGLSGGVDSTYVAWVARKYGLRPLAVHVDNGWNSSLAVTNIQNVLQKLNIDLYTYVINWEEFKDLQLAYLKAGVVDIEALTDHAIISVLFKTAKENNIHYVLSGESVETEGVLPSSWVHNKSDHANILDIHKKFGKIPINSYPILNHWKHLVQSFFFKIKYIPILDYIQYDKESAKSVIIKELSWKDYGGKHYESIFTRFYQSYILPTKFGIDKRKSHYSTLINAGQMTREEALELLKLPTDSIERIKDDKKFVVKKFGITEDEFDKIMLEQPVEHNKYDSIVNTYKILKELLSPLLRVIRIVKRT